MIVRKEIAIPAITCVVLVVVTMYLFEWPWWSFIPMSLGYMALLLLFIEFIMRWTIKNDK